MAGFMEHNKLVKKKLLFGTKNKTKKDRFQKILEPLGLKILSLADINLDLDVKEDGKTPEENAKKKAVAYFTASKIPTFAIDYGLYIDKFPKNKQPGLFVRRIFGDDREATDEEMLAYYISELKKVGGKSKGTWVSAIALSTKNGVVSKSFKENSLFVSKRSPKTTPGEPLNSIQIHPIVKKYKSEMTLEERAKAQENIEKGFFNSIKENIILWEPEVQL